MKTYGGRVGRIDIEFAGDQRHRVRRGQRTDIGIEPTADAPGLPSTSDHDAIHVQEARMALCEPAVVGAVVIRALAEGEQESLDPPIPLDHPGFGTGWWQAEWHDKAILRRWTDGDAAVPLPWSPEGTWLLEVEVAATLPYPLPLAVSDPPPIRRSA